MEVQINYLAVLLAGLSSMVVGALWYTPLVFGNFWMKLAKVKPDIKMSIAQSTVLYGGALIASLVTAYVLAHVTFLSHYFFSNNLLQDALSTAFWLWLAFTVARFFVHDSFEGRSIKLTLLNSGHELLTVMVMALIIGAMGL